LRGGDERLDCAFRQWLAVNAADAAMIEELIDYIVSGDER
jgi:hypothetical protein